MKLLLQKILKKIAKAILKNQNPTIIGITGSVGKSSTVEAIHQVLKNNFTVRKPIDNYNNEIGLPLTIIGKKSPGKSILGWFNIFAFGLKQINNKNYPKFLILEMGVDRPKDMDYLLDIAKPNISVVTAIGQTPVHLEFFKNVEELQQEKLKIIKNAQLAILNYDDLVVRQFAKQTKANVLTYGFTKGADVLVQNENFNLDFISKDGLQGYTFKLHYQGKEIPIRLKNIISKAQIYSCLAAIAIGITQKINLIKIAESIIDFKPPKGRMNLISGIKNSFLIDDSYNSSPSAVISALEVLQKAKINGKKIVALGDMLELGTMTINAHQEIGKLASQVADYIVTVGTASQYINSKAIVSGFPEDKVFHFQNSKEAGKFIQNKILHENDIVLIKGSQSIRMEKITKELMAEPNKAQELLVRQSSSWLKK